MAERVSQFARPRGALGWLAGAVMAVENRQRSAFAISLLHVQPADHILEIGFGPGATIPRLAELVPRGSVTGVDSTSVMVGQARRRNAQAIQQGRVAIHHGSAASLPFADARFERALAVNSLHHWPDTAQSLREMRRVLKPGGVLVIAGQPVWTGKDADDCQIGHDPAAQIAAAGFAAVTVRSRRMWQTPTIAVRAINPIAPREAIG